MENNVIEDVWYKMIENHGRNDKQQVIEHARFEYAKDDRRLEATFLLRASTKNKACVVKLILG